MIKENIMFQVYIFCAHMLDSILDSMTYSYKYWHIQVNNFLEIGKGICLLSVEGNYKVSECKLDLPFLATVKRWIIKGLVRKQIECKEPSEDSGEAKIEGTFLGH